MSVVYRIKRKIKVLISITRKQCNCLAVRRRMLVRMASHSLTFIETMQIQYFLEEIELPENIILKVNTPFECIFQIISFAELFFWSILFY